MSLKWRFPAVLTAALAGFGVVFGSAVGETKADQRLARHVDALAKDGGAPMDFVLAALDAHDLILFDDALHNAVEPWDFYTEMIRSQSFRETAKYIFLEVVPVNRQAALDAYFSTVPEDRTLLYPAFQNNHGWPYKTYFDFLHEVYEINKGLAPEDRLIVRAVSTPSYWKEIETLEDWENYRDRAAIGRDYDMYKLILADLSDFSEGKKGVFLTNTRHAYTDIRRAEGGPFWNTGTFFRQWHPGKTYSIRFNAPILKIEAERAQNEASIRSAEGLERYNYSWARVADGLWDAAFREYGARPVAIDLRKSPFGDAAYMGNHMHRAAPGQTMDDAYDGVVFLTPLENQHSSAKVDFFYTPAFKQELARRYRLTHSPEQREAMLERAGVDTLEAFIDAAHAAADQQLSPQARSVGDIDAWRGD